MTITEYDLKHDLTPGELRGRKDPEFDHGQVRRRSKEAGIEVGTVRARMYRMMKDGMGREEALEKALAMPINWRGGGR